MNAYKKLSIIVPVYNVEKYLRKCVTSILDNLHIEDVEVLLIDDGSTDSSGVICDQLEEEYENIKVIHKKNGGLSDARNVGISYSSGNYLMFVDSDDMICGDELNKIIPILSEEYDIIIYDWKKISENDEIISGKLNHVGIERGKYSSNDFIQQQISSSKYYWTVVWQGIYKRKLIVEKNLLFKKGIYHEDDLWFPEVVLNASEVFYTESQIYLYRMRSDSIMMDNHKNDRKHLEDIIYIYGYLYEKLPYYINEDQLLRLMYGDICKRYLHAIYHYQAYKYQDIVGNIEINNILKQCFKSDRWRGILLRINCTLYCKTMELLKK